MIKKIHSKYKKLSLQVQASIWYTICNVLNKGIALLSTPFFTRLMTAAEYGKFAIFQSWYSILIIFTSLNIFLGSYQKGMIIYKDKKDKFTSSQLGLTTTLTFIFFIIYILGINFWTEIFELSPFLMIFMFLELFSMPAFEFWAVRNRFEYKFKRYVIVTFISSLLSISCGVLAVWMSSNKVEARVVTDVISKMIFSLPLFIIIFYRGKSFYNRKYWKYALSFSLPLIPHYLANYILGQSDRLMIGKIVGSKEAAFYSVAYTISMMMMLIVSAINNSFIPYLYKCLDEKRLKDIKDVTKPIIIFVAALSLITIIFAPEIILIFAGRKFIDAIYVIPPIAISVFFIFIYSLYSNIEYFYQKTGFISIATLLSGVINLVLNYIFINLYGYYAAGYTTLFCYILLAIFHYYFYRKIIDRRVEKGFELYDSKFIILISFLLVGIMLIMLFIYKYIVIRYVFLMILFIISIKNKEIFINSLKKIKGRR